MLNPDGLIPYTCSRCAHVTRAKPGLVAVTCEHCGIIDLGTELARDRWRTVVEVRLEQGPRELAAVPSRGLSVIVPALAVVVALGIFAMAAMLAEVLL
jgi:hypothetical protein